MFDFVAATLNVICKVALNIPLCQATVKHCILWMKHTGYAIFTAM